MVYTISGIYHEKYDIYHAFKVANEVCLDCTHLWKEGPTALLHLNCLVLFRSVTFKVKWLRLYGTMQQQRWHCGLELKGQ